MKRTLVAVLLAPLALTACATHPNDAPRPNIMVLPGAKKSMTSFENDERRCRVWAEDHMGEFTPGEAAADSTARSALGGAALGAGAGALIGSTQGQVGSGALIGAASGLVLGTLAGSSAGDRSAATVQRRYDIAYAQCMTAAGNTVQAPPRREVVVYEEVREVRTPAPVVVYGGTYHRRWERW